MKKTPELRRIHSDETLEQGIARFSLKFWRTKSNREIIKSLQIGKIESLRVKSDGRILNGMFDVKCWKKEVLMLICWSVRLYE